MPKTKKSKRDQLKNKLIIKDENKILAQDKSKKEPRRPSYQEENVVDDLLQAPAQPPQVQQPLAEPAIVPIRGLYPIPNQPILSLGRESLTYIIGLEALVNLFAIFEIFVSIQSTEYFYSWNGVISSSYSSCDVGSISSPDCVEQFCDEAGYTKLQLFLDGLTCKHKNYWSNTSFMIGNYVLSGSSLVFLFCITVFNLIHRETNNHLLKRKHLSIQLAFSLWLIIYFVALKVPELFHIEIEGLRLAEIGEMIGLLLALAGEFMFMLYEYGHVHINDDDINIALNHMRSRIDQLLRLYLTQSNKLLIAKQQRPIRGPDGLTTDELYDIFQHIESRNVRPGIELELLNVLTEHREGLVIV